MESLQCTTPPLPRDGDPSHKSPPPSPQSSPPQEQEKSASPTSDRAVSPEPNCAICLGKSKNISFTDSCLHRFCFNCLLEWSKVKPECPLCKQSFKSIIHNVRSNEDYDQYHLNQNPPPYPWLNMMDMMQPRFRFRSTLTSERRLERALEHLEQDLQRRVEPGDVIPPQRTWRRRRGLASNEFRANVYNQNLWVSSLPCMGMLRDVSPQNFRNHPEEVHRLIPWLNRELQAILRCPGVSARVLDLVITQLPRHHMHSRDFRFQLEPYFREHYEHFIHEFYTFARSPYDMIGFDENANYSVRGNFWVEVVHEVSSDSSDSDVMVLSQDESRPPASTARSGSPVAGPSRAILPVDQPSDSEANSGRPGAQESNADPDAEDSDACMIVGYVKPFHERTPEIITLLSSDTEIEPDVQEIPEVNHTNGSFDHTHMYDFASSTISSDSSDSDTEYFPSSVRRPPKKVQRKKATSVKSRSKSGRSKRRDYSSCDTNSSCSCTNKKSRRKTRPRYPSSSSSLSSSSDESSRKKHVRDRKGSWRIRINMPDVRQGHSYDPPYSSSEINNFLGSSSRPKLRSIVIARTPSDHSKSSKSKPLKKIKTESGAGPSGSHRRGGSHSSHSSYRHDSSSRHSDRHKRTIKEEKKKKRKRRKDSESSTDHKSHSKKRKRILSLFSDSSD